MKKKISVWIRYIKIYYNYNLKCENWIKFTTRNDTSVSFSKEVTNVLSVHNSESRSELRPFIIVHKIVSNKVVLHLWNMFEFSHLKNLQNLPNIFCKKWIFGSAIPCVRNQHATRKVWVTETVLNWPFSCFSDSTTEFLFHFLKTQLYSPISD